MNITTAYGMSNEDILTSALIAIGGPTPIQLANAGNGEWIMSGMGIVAVMIKPFTNKEVLGMIELAPTVVLKRTLGSDDIYVVKGTVPAITQEA